MSQLHNQDQMIKGLKKNPRMENLFKIFGQVKSSPVARNVRNQKRSF